MARRQDNMVSLGPLPGAEVVRLLVGPSQREFTVHKKLLCASSSFFRYSLETVDSVSGPPGSELSMSAGAHPDRVLWLSEECPEMMDLFILWLYRRNSFRSMLEQMISTVAVQLTPANKAKIQASRRALHWNIVKLHMFAAVIRLSALQDITMDAVQDMYLRCDWDVSYSFVRHLYEECSREQSFRLRKWSVAMLAWTLSNGGGDPLSYNELFDEFPDLGVDYTKHVEKMADSRANVSVKNPQLRLPRNKLKNDERNFGFRQCSFHSHRSTVGEGRCPYALEQQSVLSPRTGEGFEEMSPQSSPVEVTNLSPSKARPSHSRLKSSGSAIWTVPESADET
ncbi:hypothetical protein UCDDA912_g07716 [Diaporthe ampelina]|uniref:BTB domain-containing protein n=1 Tax=Diaporthe ampelina TaxID=1214573 RepID=A0A0G2FCB2_9PEZI|nr:hypothetical protein UCDDA912_g07716 [Diaporthe ampelina]